MATEKNRALRLLKVKDIVKRIEEFAHIKGENFYELTRNLGFSTPYFTKAKAGVGNFGADAIVLILEHYRDLNPDWLLFGTGSKFRGGIAADKREMAIQAEHGTINKNIKKSMVKAKKMQQMFQKLADDTQKEIEGLSKLTN
jgi:hypothetical protein